MKRLALASMLTLLLCLPAKAQQPNIRPEPDSHGEAVVAEPEYRGTRASAPIPPALHIKNEGGSDGAGLCVTTAMIMGGAWQKVADFFKLKDCALWRYVKPRPGGSYPEKFVRDVDAAYGGQVKVVSYYGKDASVLEEWSGQGYAPGATMGTAAQYGYKPISHMITLLHFQRGGWACVLDNNFPGVYSWMPAGEFERRWKMTSGDGWAARWDGPAPDNGDHDAIALEDDLVLLVVAGCGFAALILLTDPKANRARPKLRIAA